MEMDATDLTPYPGLKKKDGEKFWNAFADGMSRILSSAVCDGVYDGRKSVAMEEVGHLGAASGNMLVNGEVHSLPTGSTLKLTARVESGLAGKNGTGSKFPAKIDARFERFPGRKFEACPIFPGFPAAGRLTGSAEPADQKRNCDQSARDVQKRLWLGN